MDIKILLVDDHRIVREGTRQLLEKEPGFVIVGEAADGLEAIRMAAECTPDVIVMDVRLPLLNGIQATQQIKQSDPCVHVLILSAYENDYYIYPIMNAGASGYLLKTATGAELISAIHMVYSGGMAFSPRIAQKVLGSQGSHTMRQKDGVKERLTLRELQILSAVAQGKSNKIIAELYSLRLQTVESHLHNIFGKLGVSSRTEATAFAMSRGWIQLEARCD